MRKQVWLVVIAAMALCPLWGGKADVKSKLDVMFYGYVKTDVVLQHGLGVMSSQLVQALPSNQYSYPDAKQTNIKNRIQNSEFNSFGVNSWQTRIGFLITAPAEGEIWSKGRIEFDFYGKFPQNGSEFGGDYTYPANQNPEPNKGSPMLRRAYMEFGGANWSVLAGEEWMVVGPIAPRNNNYPANADCGNLGYRMPQVRLTLYGLEKKLAFQVAADNKIGDPGLYDIDTGRASGKPTWEFGLVYSGKIGDKPMQLGVTGHTGVEAIPSVIMDGSTYLRLDWNGREINTYSYNAHWIIPLGLGISFSGEYFQGANLDGFFTGGQGNGWVYRPHKDLYEPLRSTGGWAEMMYKTPKLEIIGGYGVDDIDDGQLDRGRSNIEAGLDSTTALSADTASVSGPITVTSKTTKKLAKSNKVPTKNEMFYADINYYVTPQTMISLEWMQMITHYDLANTPDGIASGATKAGTPLNYHPGMVNRYTVAFWFYF